MTKCFKHGGGIFAWPGASNPIGQRYLRRLLVTFKFELNMSLAGTFSIPGLVLLKAVGHMRWTTSLVVLFCLIVSSVLLFLAARDSASILANVREHLLKGVGEPPFDDNGNPQKPCSA
jgi:hypothetical protein